jgi:hypothetical protein
VHGNHVTGIMVSKGLVAPPGIAPGADVVAVKVLNDQNRGFLGDWVAGLEWIAMNRPEVRAINMSLVSDAVFTGNCDAADGYNMAFAQVIGALRERGTLTFVATGNTGHSDAISSPACVTGAVAVGAVQKDDTVWFGSNADADVDLLAPGVSITSTGLGDSLATLSGTSMATPHATGSAALLFALSPALGADQAEAALRRSNVRIVDARNGLSFPRLNAFAAMQTALDETRPLLGGGSPQRDCLLAWNVAPGAATTRSPVCGASCRDNDSACDADETAGQCTFSVSACFNVADPRAPGCDTTAPIAAYRMGRPGRSTIDASNAAALENALPPLPITEAGMCSAPFAIVVPAGAARWIRLGVRTEDARADQDRLRFACEP